MSDYLLAAFISKFVLVATCLAMLIACVTTAQGEAYRGGYTFGHEVNVFCPEINSQCYWLGPNSSQAARDQLKRIYHDKKPGLYKPVCVVIEGVIDRDSPRDGFAVDYEGLIDISVVHGSCDDSAVITPGQLNHRRWQLVERNGVPVNDGDPPVVLDFGERLFVEAIDGCQRFSGFAMTRGNSILFDSLEFDRTHCSAGELATQVFADRFEWQVAFEGDVLLLLGGDTRLAFQRDDWR